MNLPRHAEIWLPGYLRDRFARWTSRAGGPMRVWLAIADHYEPFVGTDDEGKAGERVELWSRQWPCIARKYCDSAGRPPKYTFFYPQEEYRPHLIDALGKMTREGIADVEVHIHHDGEGEQNFIDRMNWFKEVLFHKHGLLREYEEKICFGFIHGNWALDNSLGGRWCGLNNEITLLTQLGCYADFTMPSGASPAQARTVNNIYWAIDDPCRPKSYDQGPRLTTGDRREGLLMIPGPLGVRWAERLVPRIEKGEIACYDLPSQYRVTRWIDLSPRLGSEIFIKLFTHGTQERNSSVLLANGLDALFKAVELECKSRQWPFLYVSCWEMYRAIEAIRKRQDPVREVVSVA
ncbi:MAG TPA: hypothetical protein VFW83_06025, partial [Bryobacteraceae bacterium]|nr:hypothetical protein [Bryobacteraceae bacterium]